MDIAIEFLLRLLERHPLAFVDWDDLHGRYASLLSACQVAGFLSLLPKRHPVPSCPLCGEGVPYTLGNRHLCDRCHGTVGPQYLQCWSLDLRAFLGWLAAQLHLRGEVRPVGIDLWQLGSHEDPEGVSEVFYICGGSLSDEAKSRLAAFRNAILLYGIDRPRDAEALPITLVSLLSILGLGASLAVSDPKHILPGGGEVRFDRRSGAVRVGGVWHGEVPVGSKEYYLLLCLSRRPDEFVAYEDIKQFVQKSTGSGDTTEEATFCHRLKNRIKARGWVTKIDLLIATGNKATGYRLRGHVGAAVGP